MIRCPIVLVTLFLVGGVQPLYAADLPHVPDGYLVEVVAEAPLVKHPMMAHFDDRGRLFIAESAGTNRKAQELIDEPLDFIRMLVDTDGDGTFDKSTIFADKLTFPQGVLCHQGAVFACAPPHVWRFEDTDDDGVADKRQELVQSFGFNGNAASIHGPFLGPDGRLYWCDGRHGHEFFDETGELVSKGKAARIFSCKTDGSDVRTFAGGGMDNPVEVDWLDSGEMIGTVNLFYGRPRGDVLVHWIEGGVYPRFDQQDCIDEFTWTGGLLPEIHNYGHVAVSGMCRERAPLSMPLQTAEADNSADQLAPVASFLVTQFNTHKVVRTTLAREGATFAAISNEDLVVWDNPDVHPTDVLEAPDGSILVIDTGGWFRIGCPTSQIAKPEVSGAIYRIRRSEEPPSQAVTGQEVLLDQFTVDEIVTRFLGDPRAVVRERAIEELASRPDELEQYAMSLYMLTASVIPDVGAWHNFSKAVPEGPARTNLVWALIRAGRLNGTLPLMFLQDRYGWHYGIEEGKVNIVPTDDVSSVTLAALSHVSDPQIPSNSLDISLYYKTLMVMGQPAHKLAAAGAAGEELDASLNVNRRPDEIERRVTLLQGMLTRSTRENQLDPHLNHAVIYALIRIAAAKQTRGFLESDEPAVRRAGLIALDQMEGGDLTEADVIPLLDTDDPALLKAVLEVISRHEGWVAETVPLFRRWLASRQTTDQRVESMRTFFLAQADDLWVQELVSDALADAQTNHQIRRMLVDVVADAHVDTLPLLWMDGLGKTLGLQSDPDSRLAAMRTIGSLSLGKFDDRLIAIALEPNENLPARVEAFAALAPRVKSVPDDFFDLTIDTLTGGGDLVEKLTLARGLADATLEDAQLRSLAESFEAIGPAIVPVLLPAYSRSENAEVGAALIAGLTTLGESLSLSPQELEQLLKTYPEDIRTQAAGLLAQLESSIAEQAARLDELQSVTSDGGDASRGRSIFYGKQAGCSACHRVHDEGGQVGPALTNIGAIRQPRDLLEAVAFPSASFAREFRPYVILTADGRVHTGVISSRTSESVTLRTADLKEVRIPRKSIDVMRESDTSIMPKGLDTKLSPGELTDLLTYLQSLKGDS